MFNEAICKCGCIYRNNFDIKDLKGLKCDNCNRKLRYKVKEE